MNKKINSKPFLVFVSINFLGEHVQNGDHSDAHISTLSHSSKEVCTMYLELKRILKKLVHTYSIWFSFEALVVCVTISM